MKIVAIQWKDSCEQKDGNSLVQRVDPLVDLLSVGILIGKFKDKDNFEYAKICYKRCLDGSEGTDDFICIPINCIIKINIIHNY